MTCLLNLHIRFLDDSLKKIAMYNKKYPNDGRCIDGNFFSSFDRGAVVNELFIAIVLNYIRR